MLDDLNLIAWAKLPQPGWNRPGEVPKALRALETAGTEADAQDAYHLVLYALGNNHAGTYYPVVLWAMPFIGELLASATAIVRQRALDVLIDLAGSFEPEPGFETCVGPSGLAVQLRVAVGEAALALRARVQQLRAREPPTSETGKLAAELLAVLDELAVGARAP